MTTLLFFVQARIINYEENTRISTMARFQNNFNSLGAAFQDILPTSPKITLNTDHEQNAIVRS